MEASRREVKMHFDQIKERRGTNALKWDGMHHYFENGESIPLWVADMDFETAPVIKKALEDRVSHGIFGYVEIPPSFYQKAAHWGTKRYGYTYNWEEMIFSAGVVPSIAYIMSDLVGADDKIIIQPPVYGPFTAIPTNFNRQLVKNPLIETNGYYTVDFEKLEAIAKEPDVRWLILCNPHNPVGRVWKKNELERIAEICIANGVRVISDEIWRDLVYEGHTHIPFASISKEAADLTFTLFSATKTFNLAGVQASYVHMPREEDRVTFKNAMQRMDFTRPNAFACEAFEAAFDSGEPWLEELMVYLSENMDCIEEWVNKKMPGVKFYKPEATYLAWLDFRDLNLKQEELMSRLNEAGVALNDGFWFGKQGIGFTRLNAACPRSVLESALECIASLCTEGAE